MVCSLKFSANIRPFTTRPWRRSLYNESGVHSKPRIRHRRRLIADATRSISSWRCCTTVTRPLAPTQAPDYLVVLDLLDIRSSEIDVDAMLEEASIMQISLSAAPDDLIRFDLEPNIGLDIRLTCKEVVVSAVRPYRRNEF